MTNPQRKPDRARKLRIAIAFALPAIIAISILISVLPNPAPSAPAPFKAFFAGDSLSVGWHATTESQGFRSIVQESISKEKPNAQFINAYKAGYTTERLAKEYPIPANVDLAIVELGTNDVGKRTAPEHFRKTYTAYVSKIRATSPDAQLICLGSFSRSGQRTDFVNKTIQSSCTSYGGTYIDLAEIYYTPGARGPRGLRTWIGTSDTGHPNNRGHQEIANRILEQIP